MEPTASDVRALDGTRVRLWMCTPGDAGERDDDLTEGDPTEGDPTDDNPTDDNPTDAVLFVHGATFGGRAAFEPPGVEGWLTATARGGRTAAAVDIRGYGDSERPDSLAAEPGPEPPVQAGTAALDALAAFESLEENHDRVHIVGYSWGSIICGTLLTEHDVTPASLTQFAPVFAPDESFATEWDPGTPPEPSRAATRAELESRWNDQLPTDDPAAWRGGSEGADPAFDAFWRALSDSGQGRVREGEQVIVAPNGTLVDLAAAARGKEPYPADAIDVPTLVVRGSLDPTSTREDALALYDELGSREKEYAEISRGTHFLTLESRKDALFDAVGAFQTRACAREQGPE